MGSCAECKYAFKAKAEDYIACIYWQREWEKSLNPIEMFQSQMPPNLELALGWASRTKPCNGETFWAIKGTATDGLIYNNQLLVKNDCCCSNYK